MKRIIIKGSEDHVVFEPVIKCFGRAAAGLATE